MSIIHPLNLIYRKIPCFKGHSPLPRPIIFGESMCQIFWGGSITSTNLQGIFSKGTAAAYPHVEEFNTSMTPGRFGAKYINLRLHPLGKTPQVLPQHRSLNEDSRRCKWQVFFFCLWGMVVAFVKPPFLS